MLYGVGWYGASLRYATRPLLGINYLWLLSPLYEASICAYPAVLLGLGVMLP